jgi:hypothetical protein
MRGEFRVLVGCLVFFGLVGAGLLPAQDRAAKPEQKAEKDAKDAPKRDPKQAAIDRCLAALDDATKPFDRTVALTRLEGLRLLPATGVPVYVKLLDHKAIRSELLLYDQVTRALAKYGPAAKEAVPKLLADTRDKKLDRAAAQCAFRAMLKIDPRHPDVLPLLIQNLDSANGQNSHTQIICDALGESGPAAAKALPELEKILDDTETSVAAAAYRAIGRIRNLPRPSLEELEKQNEIDWKARDGGFAVLAAIEEAGPKARFAVPWLLKALNEEHPKYQQAAVMEALGRTKPLDPRAVEALFDGLTSDDDVITKAASVALDLIARQRAAGLLPAYIEGLRHPLAKVRTVAALELRYYGRAAKPALTEVIEGIKQADAMTPYKLYVAFLDILRELGPDGAKAADTLTSQLSERSAIFKGRNKDLVHQLRRYIFATLADVGGSKKALPAILDGLKNSDPRYVDVYAAAARAAGALGAEGRDAIPGLLLALKADFRDHAVSFQSFDTPHLVQTIGATSGRIEAIRALARMGPAAREALPLLTRLAGEKPTTDDQVPPWDGEARKAIKAIEGK